MTDREEQIARPAPAGWRSGMEEAARIVEARLPLYPTPAQSNAARECLNSIRAALSAAPPPPQDGGERLREAADLQKAVNAAALTWCGEKDRETSLGDITYFKNNWSALPGLRNYVDREIGRSVRAALRDGGERD